MLMGSDHIHTRHGDACVLSETTMVRSNVTHTNLKAATYCWSWSSKLVRFKRYGQRFYHLVRTKCSRRLVTFCHVCVYWLISTVFTGTRFSFCFVQSFQRPSDTRWHKPSTAKTTKNQIKPNHCTNWKRKRDRNRVTKNHKQVFFCFSRCIVISRVEYFTNK